MHFREPNTTTARALFLLSAFASFVFSVALFFTGSENQGIFVGLWVPSIIGLGAFLAPRDASASARERDARGVAVPVRSVR